MSGQGISELLISFGHKERSDFYSRWCMYVCEKEYVALDITSVSSYSKNIGCMEWGYNRDGENLPQVNILCCSERSPCYRYIKLFTAEA